MIPKTRIVFIRKTCYKTSVKAEVNSSFDPELKKVFFNEITKMLICLKTVTQISIFINMYILLFQELFNELTVLMHEMDS